MASKEDLSDQLSLTTKLAAQIERMAAAAEKLDSSYQSQLDSATKLVAVMNQLNIGGASQSVVAFNKVLQDMQEQMKDSAKASESAFQKFSKKVEETGKTIKEKFPKSVIIGTAALSGFGQGIRNVLALGKGVAGFTASFASGIGSITASILAIPFKMFEGLIDLAAKATTGSAEWMQAIEDLRKQFGALYGPTNKAIRDVSVSMKGFSDTGLSTYRVFGWMAERLQYIRELATGMGTSFNLLRKEIEDNGGAILAYQKGLGLTAESLKAVAQKSDMMGVKSSDTLKDMTKYSYAFGKALNLDAKVISREMGEAMKDMAHFGTTSTKSLGESVAFAHKFGLELKDITGTLDKFDSFDDAAEHAANLSQAFGVNIDSFEMMKAAASGDVGKQTEILRKAFREQGVDATKFNNIQRALIRDNTGLSDAAIQSAFSMKKQGVSFKDVEKTGDKAQKSTMTQTQAMQQLSDAIERLVKTQSLSGGFWDMFLKGIVRGITWSKDFYGTIYEIQRALQQVYWIGVKLGTILPKIVPGLGDILGGIKEAFQPKIFTDLFNGVSKAVQGFFKGKHAGSLESLMDGLHASVMGFFDAEKPAGKRILEGAKTFMIELSSVISKGITYLSDHLATGMQYIVDLLTGKKSLDLTGAAGTATGGLGFLQQVIGPIAESLKHAWKVLKDPLKQLIKELGKKIYGFVKTELWPMVKPSLPWLAVTLFGPAFGRAAISALASTLLKSVLPGTTTILKKAAGSIASKLGEGGALEGAGAVAGPAAIAAAAAAIGSGVNKYTDTITDTLDHSSKVIAAGATGLIDALTLGLLPADWSQMIAETLAKLVDGIYDGIGKVFGRGFGESLKRYVASEFEVFGSLWKVITDLLGDSDQASFDKSVEELQMSLLRFASTSFEFLFDQLPNLLERLSIKVMASLSGVLVKLVAASLSTITEGIDKTFGTNLSARVVGLSDSLRDNINKLADKANVELKAQSDKMADASAKFQDTYLRTAEDKAKMAAQAAAFAAKKAAGTQTGAAQDSIQGAVDSFKDMASNIQVVKDVQKQLNQKGFDLPGTIAALRDKLKGVSFDIISDDQVKGLDVTSKNLEKLSSTVESVSGMMQSISEFPKSVAKAANAIKADSSQAALKAVSDMVKIANQLNDALADGNLNKIDIKAKLANVASAVGLGGKATYTVDTGKSVMIQVNMTVTMDAGEVEKAIIYRNKSIITDRLNFATSQPTVKGSDLITPGVEAQNPLQSGPK